MPQLPHDITALVEGEKSLGHRPEWDEESNPRWSEFVAPLISGHIGIGGFELRVKVSKQFTNRDCMAQLEYAPAGRRSAVELRRIDWRPFHRHQNNGLPVGDPLRLIDGTHDHTFIDNYIEAEHRMRAGGSLPIAWPVNPDPNTVSEFLAFCGERFRINDIGLVGLPVTSGDLFWAKDD